MIAETMPAGVSADPALKYLGRKMEELLGIRAAAESLAKLKSYLEERSGVSGTRAFETWEGLLSSREELFSAAPLLTVNETYFFREESHFSLLFWEVLPRLARLSRPLRICSAASSIGCEAYSLAMLLDHFNALYPGGLSFGIDAFDVSGPAIETARRGRYTDNAFREDGARWNFLLDKYIESEGQDFFVSPRIKEKVRFYPHNILEGFKGSYDIIFFRNSLIYFTPQNRLAIVEKIAEALYNEGILIMGTSETSSLDHPLLGSRCSMNTFYFEKLPASSVSPEKPQAVVLSGKVPETLSSSSPAKPARPSLRTRREGMAAEIAKLAAQMEMGEGRAVMEKVMGSLKKGRGGAEEGRENELIAGVLYFLGREDYDSASRILIFLEKGHDSAVISFLRGEYHYLTNSADKAEAGYAAATGKDPALWPAFYRISSLAAEGNPARYEYKTKKALESLALGREKGYEVFIGGFSPDYYRRILEKRLDDLKNTL